MDFWSISPQLLVKEDAMRSAAGNRNSVAGMRWGRISSAVVAGTVLVGAAASSWAQGPTYAKKVIYSFAGGSDGADPLAGLVRDAAGNLYGTTYAGGDYGSGTVFRLDTTGKEAVLYSFSGGPDGGYPYAGLILDAAGNLYGTADAGGAHNYGVVFEVPAGGAEGVLYSFTGTGGDGADPLAGLVRDAAGNLYGTTASGGASGLGTVFKVSAGGAETVLHSFTGGSDGEYPYASVIRDAAGNLYGTTYAGGASGLGTVFKIDTQAHETVLYSFRGGADGEYPSAGLVRDAAGNLYGTTNSGGSSGDGIVFKISPAGKETVLHSFKGGKDGEYPYASLIRDAAGNLYGTTYGGGASGWGTVFEIDPTGKETVLYSFAGAADGASPEGGLVQDTAGHLYGTTKYGGAFGAGTVFELSPAR